MGRLAGRVAMAAAVVVAVAALVHAAGVPARAAGEAPPPLACSFELGVSWSYGAGGYTSATPSPLAFDIDQVDLEGQTARLIIGGTPAGQPLRVVRALNANHFLEVVQEGFLNVTTIYDADPVTGRRPAIHSRHLGLLGEPIFAQYAGFCRPK